VKPPFPPPQDLEGKCGCTARCGMLSSAIPGHLPSRVGVASPRPGVGVLSLSGLVWGARPSLWSLGALATLDGKKKELGSVSTTLVPARPSRFSKNKEGGGTAESVNARSPLPPGGAGDLSSGEYGRAKPRSEDGRQRTSRGRSGQGSRLLGDFVQTSGRAKAKRRAKRFLAGESRAVRRRPTRSEGGPAESIRRSRSAR